MFFHEVFTIIFQTLILSYIPRVSNTLQYLQGSACLPTIILVDYIDMVSYTMINYGQVQKSYKLLERIIIMHKRELSSRYPLEAQPYYFLQIEKASLLPLQISTSETDVYILVVTYFMTLRLSYHFYIYPTIAKIAL